MSQPSLTSYYTSRKRPASDDIVGSKNKVPHVDPSLKTKIVSKRTLLHSPKVRDIAQDEVSNVEIACEKSQPSKVSETINQKGRLEVFAKKSNALNVVKEAAAVSASTSVQSARKELSLGDIRKKITKSSRFAELKERAERLSKGIKELKEKTATTNDHVDKPYSPPEKDIAHDALPAKKMSENSDEQGAQPRLLMSPRKVVVSPVKSPRKTPAYMKQAEEEAKGSSLDLPSEYRHLAELFQGMETIVSLMNNRNEKVTLEKLKKSVQTMLKRNFTEKHLAQIKQLVPDFYNFEMEKCKQFSTSTQRESYQLVITPNFPNDIKVMNPSVLLERRRHFANVLLQLVKKHHAQFLLTLELPIVISEDKVVRWHPEFDIEKIPDVESARLPEAPNTEKFSTAQDVLAKARELFKCNTKVQRAMEKLAQAKARGLTEGEKTATGLKSNITTTSSATQTSTPSSSNVVILNPALRNLPLALLEKVKAKQAAKALAAMTRSPEVEKKYMIYSRLPELAKTLRNIYVTERKNVLALNVVLSKLEYSFKSTAVLAELRDDIKVLCDEAPQLVQLHNMKSNTYLKLDRNIPIQNIISKLEDLAKKLKP